MQFNLEGVSTKEIRHDIKGLLNAQLISTPQGELKAKLQKVLDEA